MTCDCRRDHQYDVVFVDQVSVVVPLLRLLTSAKVPRRINDRTVPVMTLPLLMPGFHCMPMVSASFGANNITSAVCASKSWAIIQGYYCFCHSQLCDPPRRSCFTATIRTCCSRAAGPGCTHCTAALWTGPSRRRRARPTSSSSTASTRAVRAFVVEAPA